MSIFEPIGKHVQELDDHIMHIIHEQETMALCLSPGATIVETTDLNAFIGKLLEIVDPTYNVIGEDLLAEELRKYQGRPVIRWDVKLFRKNDAIGSMYKLSQLPKDPMPIVIIENITEIPDGDRAIYDDPILVENILLHAWKNDFIHLTHHQGGPFQLNKWDYTVLFPVNPGTLANLHFSVRGELAYMRYA